MKSKILKYTLYTFLVIVGIALFFGFSFLILNASYNRKINNIPTESKVETEMREKLIATKCYVEDVEHTENSNIVLYYVKVYAGKYDESTCHYEREERYIVKYSLKNTEPLGWAWKYDTHIRL